MYECNFKILVYIVQSYHPNIIYTYVAYNKSWFLRIMIIYLLSIAS